MIPQSGSSPQEGTGYPLQYYLSSLVAYTVKNLPDLGSIPGLGRSSGEGNGNPLQDSCLENPVDRGVHGQRSPQGFEESGTAEGTKHSTAHTTFGGILCVVLSSSKTNFHFYAEFRKSSLLVIKNCGEHGYCLLTVTSLRPPVPVLPKNLSTHTCALMGQHRLSQLLRDDRCLVFLASAQVFSAHCDASHTRLRFLLQLFYKSSFFLTLLIL